MEEKKEIKQEEIQIKEKPKECQPMTKEKYWDDYDGVVFSPEGEMFFVSSYI